MSAWDQWAQGGGATLDPHGEDAGGFYDETDPGAGTGGGGGGDTGTGGGTVGLPTDVMHRRLAGLTGKVPLIRNGKKKRRTLLLPQRKADEGRLTVVLDMDETLIHSEFSGCRDYRQAEERLHATRRPDFHITLYEDDPDQENEIVHVYKRPGLENFLEKLSKICEPVIFTAALPLYARPILKVIDPKRLCRSRLYRNATTKYRGYPHVKSLRHLGRDLRRTIMVDNSPYALSADPYNGYLIENFYDDPQDVELDRLYEHIVQLVKLQDVRPYLHKNFNFIKTLNEIMGD